MGRISNIMRESELYKLVAGQTLERTFGYDRVKIKTFHDNFDIILAGHIADWIEKNRTEAHEQRNHESHRKTFEVVQNLQSND